MDISSTDVQELAYWLTAPHNPNGVLVQHNQWRDPQVVTQLARVPTWEHTARIIGKDGLKVKCLCKQTNTRIKCSSDIEQPEFTITGRPECVEVAKTVIEMLAQRYDALIASRPSFVRAGEIVIYVAVPQQYIGAVIGSGGSYINQIKKRTNTRINNPRLYVNPYAFQVIGTKANVMAAKVAIGDRVAQCLSFRPSSRIAQIIDEYKREHASVGHVPIVIQTHSLPVIHY